MTGPQKLDEDADKIIKLYGPDAVRHVVRLIENAVRQGDDAEVERLDRLLGAVERAVPKPPN